MKKLTQNAIINRTHAAQSYDTSAAPLLEKGIRSAMQMSMAIANVTMFSPRLNSGMFGQLGCPGYGEQDSIASSAYVFSKVTKQDMSALASV